MNTLTKAAQDVLAERQRQIEREGYSADHDDEHGYGELARAAVCYARQAANPDPETLPVQYGGGGNKPVGWPWGVAAWKPKSPRRDLIRATALLLASIEQIDRADSRATSGVAADRKASGETRNGGSNG